MTKGAPQFSVVSVHSIEKVSAGRHIPRECPTMVTLEFTNSAGGQFLHLHFEYEVHAAQFARAINDIDWAATPEGKEQDND